MPIKPKLKLPYYKVGFRECYSFGRGTFLEPHIVTITDEYLHDFYNKKVFVNYTYCKTLKKAKTELKRLQQLQDDSYNVNRASVTK